MTPERWQELKKTLEAALEREAGERDRYLCEVCPEPSLRRELESLIAAYQQAPSTFWERPIDEDGAAASSVQTQSSDKSAKSEVNDETLGESENVLSQAAKARFIGPYRLLRKLGEGGMGQVWLAEQGEPLRRLVALKLIRTGIYDNSLLQRFLYERQSLAIMTHPCIAKVFDAGATEEGQPYFIMEYVPGLPITDYCDQKKLKIRERLQLFLKVCDAVQHAHQKAIIHRDLKPANILVVETDGQPTPRIIDFGLAKMASQNAQPMFLTQFGAFVGTPGYMSPEQANPAVEDIDTRTDVYSLGVVLYVLLTGLLPVDSALWKEKSLHAVLRRVCDEDPPHPSIRFMAEQDTQRERADHRGMEPRQLIALLRGDLGLITLKSIQRDRPLRYGAPSDLAADIQRYLLSEPVTARPPSANYRLRKYLRRHRVGVGIAVGLAIVLFAFGVTQAIQLRQITHERDRANRITDFMKSMFNVADPSEARGTSITAREILDKASEDIAAGLTRDPELQAQLMDVMGSVFDNLGLYQRAESLYSQSLQIQRRLLGVQHPETLGTMSNLAWNWVEEGRYAEAEQLYQQTLEGQRRILGPAHSSTLKTMSNMANLLRNKGQYADAEKLYRETFDIQRRSLGPQHPDTLSSMNILALTLDQEGHSAEAENLEHHVLELQQRLLGSDHPDALLTMNNLAFILNHEGRYAEAEKLQRETVSIQRRVLGAENPKTLMSQTTLASTLEDEGRYTEAEKLLREILDVQQRVVGRDNPNTLTSRNNLASTLARAGHYAEAETIERQTLEIQRRTLGPEHADVLLTMSNLADSLVHEGHWAEGEKLQRETLEIQQRVIGPESPDAAVSKYNLGVIAAHQGQRDKAFAMLRDAIDHGLRPEFDLGVEQDPDLKALHRDPRFTALVTHAKERAGAASKSN